MNAEEYRKHCRSSTIARYEDFKIHPEDQKIIQQIAAEISTKETPIVESPPVPPYIFEICQVIDCIRSSHNIEKTHKQDRLKSLKNQILEEVFKVSSSPTRTKKEKKIKKVNNSIRKLSKKVVKVSSCRAKSKIPDCKTKKPVLTNSKIRKPHYRSMNLPKLSSRSIRTGSSNIEYKPSFLV